MSGVRTGSPLPRQAGARVDLVTWGAASIVALGFVLRVDIRQFWNHGDEGIYYRIAHAPIGIASEIIAGNAHPPVYYCLLRGVAWFTDDFFWLRVPALLFGTLAIYALYRVGSRLGGPVCGLVSAAVLAVSPGAIALSQVARPYALVVLLVIGALGSLLRYLDDRSPRAIAIYAALMIAGGFVHYSAWLAFAGIGVALAATMAFGRFDWPQIRELFIANALVAAVGASMFAIHVQPVLMNSAMRAEARGQWLGDQFTASPAGLWSNFLGVFDYLAGREWAGVAALVFLVSIAVALANRRAVWAGICLGVVGVAALASATSLYPFGASRHSVYLAPFLLLGIGLGVALLGSAGPRSVTVAALSLIVLAFARDPVARAIGVSDARPRPEPEFEIPTEELQALRDPMHDLAATPGLVLMDLSTTYTLLPMIGVAGTQTSWQGGPVAHGFAWGSRRVVVIPYWQMVAGEPGAGQANHLWTHIRRVRDPVSPLNELMAHDVSVISADGRRLTRAIRSLAVSRAERQNLVSDLTRTDHLSVFHLEIDQYQQALARAIRARAAERAQNLELEANDSAEAERVRDSN